MTAQSTHARDLELPLRLIALALKLVTADRAVAAAGVCVAVSVVLALAAATGPFGTADVHANAATVVRPAPLDVSPLHRFAPFGKAAALLGGDAAGLDLRGIMLARPRSTSLAIIETAGRSRSFAIGDTLPSGAILDAVEIDHVVLRADGVLRWLVLRGKAGKGGTTALAPTTLGAEPVQDVGNPPPPGELDPQSLLGSLGASATTEGYRVGAVPSEAMRRAGLLAGDVVEKVDGAAVGDPDRDRAAYDDAVVAGQVSIDVVRAGHHLALTLPLP